MKIRQRLHGIDMAHFHMTMTMVWAGLAVPTLLWWKESILWVALMSEYANTVGHWSSFQAARAEQNTVSNEQFDELMGELREMRDLIENLSSPGAT